MGETVTESVMKFDEKKMAKLPLIDRENPGRKFSEKEDKALREMRVYEFSNTETPGVMQKFTYGDTRNKMTFNLFHGGKYELPRFLARHIEACGTPIYDYKPTGYGQLEKHQAGQKRRFMMREAF